jgi:hypothetical protein
MASTTSAQKDSSSALTRTRFVLALTAAGSADEAMAAANGLISAAEATRNPYGGSRGNGTKLGVFVFMSAVGKGGGRGVCWRTVLVTTAWSRRSGEMRLRLSRVALKVDQVLGGQAEHAGGAVAT